LAEDIEQFGGEWAFPDWTMRTGLRVEYNDFRVAWETRYLSSVSQDLDAVDAFSTALSLSDTCGVTDNLTCRDYAEADNCFLHNLSLYYFGDMWTFGGGIRNVLNEAPPVMDSSESGSIVNNTPLGFGYDLNGRVYFLNAAVNFGGGE